MTLATDLDQLAIDTIRTLSIDAVQKANSGHPGTPMALAPIAYLLYTRTMRHNPGNANWPDRDRFVLSAGHASMLLYSVLYLTGYGLTLGTGVGGGVVIGGMIFRGATGLGAELGHVVVEADGLECPGKCPNRGCLEAYCSGTALQIAASQRYGRTVTGFEVEAAARSVAGEVATQRIVRPLAAKGPSR